MRTHPPPQAFLAVASRGDGVPHDGDVVVVRQSDVEYDVGSVARPLQLRFSVKAEAMAQARDCARHLDARVWYREGDAVTPLSDAPTSR